MAVKVGKYHLFQRQLNTGTFWYYWFYDEGKKQVQKACWFGCADKRDAVAFQEDLLRADLLFKIRLFFLSFYMDSDILDFEL